jgi:hypothetical protein
VIASQHHVLQANAFTSSSSSSSRIQNSMHACCAVWFCSKCVLCMQDQSRLRKCMHTRCWQQHVHVALTCTHCCVGHNRSQWPAGFMLWVQP